MENVVAFDIEYREHLREVARAHENDRPCEHAVCPCPARRTLARWRIGLARAIARRVMPQIAARRSPMR